VVLEGLDGAGTTTQMKLLSRKLEELGRPFTTTWEPTDGTIGRLIRSILVQDIPALPRTIALLYAADRNEHLSSKDGILSRTAAGELVICDRYVFSSLAYQSVQCGREFVLALNSGFPLPQCLFFLDTPVEVCQSRIEGRAARELYDGMEFQARVRQEYLASIDRFRGSGMRIEIVDGDRPPMEIHDGIWAVLAGMPIM
jgi:dTMP kinase